MKTSLYKYFCLLLMTVCCLQAHADEFENKGLIHILRLGLAGGGGLHLTPADCVMKSNVGGGGALAFDYAFYKSFDKVDLGLRTGLDLGYMYLPYHAEFAQQQALGFQIFKFRVCHVAFLQNVITEIIAEPPPLGSG